MDPKKFPIDLGGYSFSFTQSLNSSDCDQIYNFLTKDAVNLELEILDEIDRLVTEGLTHPEADAIIKKLTNGGYND